MAALHVDACVCICMTVYAHMHPDDADNKEEAGSIGVWYTDISIAAELLALVGALVALVDYLACVSLGA